MKVIPKRTWKYPAALEREYSKYLVKFVKENMEIVKQFVPQMEELLLVYGLNMDTDSPALTQLEILLDRIHTAMKNPSQMLPVINSMALKVDRYNRLELEAITKSVLGVPLREIPFDRIMKQDATADDTLREMWVAENLDYLKNVDEQTMQKIKMMLTGKITGNVNRRELTRDLVKEIENITGFKRNRAILIARDQVGKLNGQLTEYRQRHAGITQYKWSTSKDSRVRPAHKDLEGKIFDWDNPPSEGNPGMPIRCRCVAIPVIDLDRIITKPVPQSYVSVEKSVQPTAKDSIISSEIIQEELAVADNGIKNNLTVNFRLVNTKEYHDKYIELTSHKAVDEALYKRATIILESKSGSPYEDIAVLDARTGKLLAQNNTAVLLGMEYRCGLSAEQIKLLQRLGKRFEIIHNHPNNSLPSTSDIKGLFKRPLAVASNIICHNGTVYRMVKLKPVLDVDELVSETYKTIKQKYPNWSRPMVEEYVSEILIKELEKRGYIKFLRR